jgi:hypothetical protein
MSPLIQLLVQVILMAAEYFLGKAKDNKAMMDLFYQFVERRQKDYLNSKILRDDAKALIYKISTEPWVETK